MPTESISNEAPIGLRRVALVTGAARGIGRAIAMVYQRNGWDVVAPTRAELDLGSLNSVQQWCRQVPMNFDVLINNAGENQVGPLEAVSMDVWQRHLNVNLTSAMMLMQACSQHMRANRWGRIVNISSIFGLVSRSGRAPYASAKTGLLGLTRTAALEWGHDGVLVNAICPGYIETDLTRQNNSTDQIAELAKGLPLGRLGQPEEVAEAVYFFGSERNTFITGQAVVVDGGFTSQ